MSASGTRRPPTAPTRPRSAVGPDGRAVELPYDTLVVAAGASHSYFGKDYFAEFAPGMKKIEDALYLRDGSRAHRIITFETAREEVSEGRTASGRPTLIMPITEVVEAEESSRA